MVSERSGFYPRPKVDTAGCGVASQAGGMLLTETIRVAGLGRSLAVALAPWMPVRAVHHPAKIVLDLAVTLALGGDCLADIALLRAEPGLFGLVASDPTVSRTVDCWPPTLTGRLRRSTSPAPQPALWCGSGPAKPLRIMTWMLTGR